jgi:imidazoleglycerol-phosphate dehydratase
MRIAQIERQTKETKISVEVNLDGSGKHDIKTGIGFLDHMIEQIACHGLIDIILKAEGDLHVDSHHTTEDSAIALGSAIKKALGDKKGINRYGFFYVPMDEALSRVVIDLSGRIYPVWKVEFSQEKIGEIETEMFREWFFAFASAVGCNLHVENFYGVNNHHIIESCFKGLAKSLRIAVANDPKKEGEVISSKGVL